MISFNWATSFQKWIEDVGYQKALVQEVFQLGHFFSEMDSVISFPEVPL